MAALAMLALAWPLILALMALVRLTSRGPALYKQVRLGLDGRPYLILKLRTMYHDCERATGPQWAKARDPRATPLGRFLRATHLDELPQLWNVVRGEMSLVGPRPERPEFVRELEGVIPNYRERLRVRPGITGLAQVQLPPDEDIDSVARKVAYDVYYVERINLWLDLRILVGTALKMAGISYGCIRLLVALPRPEVVLGNAPQEEPERRDAAPRIRHDGRMTRAATFIPSSPTPPRDRDGRRSQCPSRSGVAQSVGCLPGSPRRRDSRRPELDAPPARGSRPVDQAVQARTLLSPHLRGRSHTQHRPSSTPARCRSGRLWKVSKSTGFPRHLRRLASYDIGLAGSIRFRYIGQSLDAGLGLGDLRSPAKMLCSLA